MTALTTTAHAFIASGVASGSSAKTWLARAMARIVEGRPLAAEREVARFITNHGGRLTDEVERRIGRSFL